MSWLLTEMTTRSSDFMKMPQGVVDVTFYGTTRCETSFNLPKGQLASFSSVREWSSCKLVFLQPCLLIVWRRFLMTKWRSWMTQAVIEARFLITSITITFCGKLRQLRYCERITSHRLRNITGVLKDTSWRSVKKKRQSSPVTGLEWPRGFQEVKVPRFPDNGTGWW